MSEQSNKVPRGRPKSLNREHVLAVAIKAYWEAGVDSVSLNEICRQSNISKPGLYREFGGEDGLMKAALATYQQQVLGPMFQMLETDAPFHQTLDQLVSFIRPETKGCLLVKMRESRQRVGEETQEQIDRTHQYTLAAYQHWIQSAKARGEFTADISAQLAAVYVDTQLSQALSQVVRGESAEQAREVLQLAFSVLR